MSQKKSGESKEPSALVDKMIRVPFVEKYRPRLLDDVISHTEVVQTLQRLIERDSLPHLLFYGPSGTGKTSTILAISRQLNGEDRWKQCTLHLNASDDRSLDVVRERIIPFAREPILIPPSDQKTKTKSIKIVILDEADSMTIPALLALRRVIEIYTSNVRFCLIANYATKIPDAIQSRCSRFRFGPLPLPDVVSHLQTVIENESIRIEKKAIDALAKLGQGDMRQTLCLLENCAVLLLDQAGGGSGDKNDAEDAEDAEKESKNCRVSSSVKTNSPNPNPQTTQTPKTLKKDPPVVVTVGMVYAVADRPSPLHIETIHSHLMRDSLAEALTFLQNFQETHSFSVTDLLTGLYERLMENPIFPPSALGSLLNQFSMIEHALALGANDSLQLGSLVATYVVARKSIR
jgi:DNA polymerase III delta prime subunit